MKKLESVVLLVLVAFLPLSSSNLDDDIPPFNVGRLLLESCSLLNERLPINEMYGKKYVRGISCRDETNERIPWFIAYKIPKIANSPIDLVREGRGYAYLHPELIKSSRVWRLSSKGIDDEKSFLGRTLKERNAPASMWIAYNDKGPEGTNGAGAHSKGIIMFHVPSATAVWIVHSVPGLPLNSERSFYPNTALLNGQIMMCINILPSTLEDIVRNLHRIEPHRQGSHIAPLQLIDVAFGDEWTGRMFRELGNRAPSDSDYEADMGSMQIIQQGGQRLEAFFKPPINSLDFYSQYIAPVQRSHIQVQTWTKGAGGRMCAVVRHPQYGIIDEFTCVQDITNIRIQAQDCRGVIHSIDFSSSKDHSKWAVTEDRGKPWVCVSDLNRMNSQMRRGGSALCIHNADVWTVFNRSISRLHQSGDVPEVPYLPEAGIANDDIMR